MTGSLPFRYHLLTYRREQLVLPIALWLLSCLFVVTMRGEPRATIMASGMLGFVFPMMGGVLAASALIGDPTLELQFAAPRSGIRTLVERLALLFGVIVVAAVTFQLVAAGFGVDLSLGGNVLSTQLIWLIPTLSMMVFSSLVALMFAQGTMAVMVVGALWIMELLLRDWFAASPWAKYLFWSMGAYAPTHPDLPGNQLALTGLTVLFLIISALLLRRQERYI